MERSALPLVPLHLTSLAILSPNNAPLFVRSFTGSGDQDVLRHYHLAHAAVDVIEERIIMTTTPNKPADSYLGLLFCMEDMAFYGFQTPTKLRMVLSVALVDAMIKDADIVAISHFGAELQIFRAVHHLLLEAVHNSFLSLPTSFRAKPDPSSAARPAPTSRGRTTPPSTATPPNESVPTERMYMTGPDDLRPEWLERSESFQRGVRRIGDMLNGGRVSAGMAVRA